MNVSCKRILLVTFLIVLWNLVWFLSPRTVSSRRCVEGVCWECKQLLQYLSEKERAGFMNAIKVLEGGSK